MIDNQTTDALITKACYAQIQAYALPHYSSLFYELAVQLYKLQKKVDELEKNPNQAWNSAIREAIHIIGDNRFNSNGATMTIDSLRALIK